MKRGPRKGDGERSARATAGRSAKGKPRGRGPSAGRRPQRGDRQGGGPGPGEQGDSRPLGARGIAATVLHRVCDDGAFAMRALDAELQREPLSPRDAALCTEIVYGTLRVLPEIDRVLAERLPKGLAATDPLTLAVLRGAVYQLLHLGRVPPHAIVNEAVSFVRRKRSHHSAGFVNAVLRRVAEKRPAEPTPPDRVLLPSWLEAALVDSLGETRAALFAGPRPLPPPLCLATHPGQRDTVLAELRAALPDAEFEPGHLSPQAIIARRAGDPRRFPGYAEGRFWGQEEGAQLVALAVHAGSGQRVADLCSGHGGKTLMLGTALGPAGHVTAVDIDDRKLERLQSEWARLGLPEEGVNCEALDLSVGLGGLRSDYDRVLVDAPCSGLGTLHRRPEMLLRLTPQDPARFAALQVQIARRAAALVRDGGELFVAVCTPLSAEGRGVAEALEGALPELTRLPAGIPGLGVQADDDRILRIGPWSGAGDAFPDAYQVLRFALRRSA